MAIENLKRLNLKMIKRMPKNDPKRLQKTPKTPNAPCRPQATGSSQFILRWAMVLMRDPFVE